MRALSARTAAVAAAITATFVVSPVHAARPALAGDTVVTASRNAYVSVQVPRTATLRDPLVLDGAAGDVQVSSPGRQAAFVLVQENASDADRLVVVGGRVPDPKQVLHYTQVASGRVVNGAAVIPAGNYRLYLISDRGPTTVRLRFGGLRGSTRLNAVSRANARFGQPAASLDSTPARATYAVGADMATSGRTLFLGAMYVSYDKHVDTVYSDCFYFERPTSPAPYFPGCPSPEYRSFAPISLPGSALGAARHLLLSSWLPLASGHYGGGVSFVSATPASDVRYGQIWLNY